jgi:predicted negative regulator of RcsB-dependent stress response
MMMKKVTALVIFAVMTAVLGFGQTSADEWFNKAVDYFNSGDYANAVTAYSEAIKRGSSDLNAYWVRGLAYYRIKNYDAAIADFTSVIKGAPNFPDVYVVRGDAYGAKGLYHKAVTDYRTGLEKDYDPSGFVIDKSSKADMWLCGAMYMEITVNRFLGKSDAVTKYENRLKTVCDKNKVTRAEVETFYQQNIGALVAAVVDAEFNTIKFSITTTDNFYNGTLTRNAQNQYVLSYEGYFNGAISTKTLPIASSLEALSSAMSRSGDFSATTFNKVRDNAALIPAVIFDGWKRYTPNMVNPYELLTKALTDLYTTPSAENYKVVLGINARSLLATITDGDNFTSNMLESIGRTLKSLNPALFDKVNIDLSINDRIIAAAGVPNEPQYGIFTLAKKTGDAVFVSKTKSVPGLLVR